MEKIIKHCQDIGCTSATCIPSCIDCIEKILNDPRDFRRENAMRVLDEIRQIYSGSESDRIQSMYSQFFPRSTPRTNNRYLQYIDPLDPFWAEELEQFLQEPFDVSEFQRFSDAFESTLAKVLKSGSHSTVLPKVRRFLIRLSTDFDQYLPQPRLKKLKIWIAESRELDLNRMLQESEHASSSELWNAIEYSADKLAVEAVTEMQQGYADNVIDQVYEYRNWKSEFYHLSSALKQAEDKSYTTFWGEHLGVGSRDAIDDQLSIFSQNLKKWGNESDRANWKKSLEDFTQRALSALIKVNEVSSNRQSLALFEQFQKNWPESLGCMPREKVWKEAEKRIQDELTKSVQQVLQNLRDGYESREQIEEQFEQICSSNSSLLQADDSAYQQFKSDIALLHELENNVKNWTQEGNTKAIGDGRLDKCIQDMKILEPKWKLSPGYKSLCKQMEDLKKELNSLSAAIAYQERNEYEQAIEALAFSESPVAQSLKQELKIQANDDLAMRLLLRGDLYELNQQLEKATLSVAMQNKLERVQRGAVFVERLEQEWRSSNDKMPLVSEDIESFYKKIKKFTHPQLPDNIELGEIQKNKLASLKNALQQRLVSSVYEFVKLIKSGLLFYPLMDADSLIRMEVLRSAVYTVLQDEDFDPFHAGELIGKLAPIESAMLVHTECRDKRFHLASERLTALENTDALDFRELRKLEATVRMGELLDTRPVQRNAWLEFYRKYADVVLDDPDSKRRYLDLLRQCTGEHESRAKDGEILKKFVKEEQALAELLTCFDNAKAINKLQVADLASNGELVRCLLEYWSQNTRNYNSLTRLWGMLSESEKKRIWRNQNSPLVIIKEVAKQQLHKLKEDLENPDIPVVCLKEKCDLLLQADLVDKQDASLFDAAAKVSKQLRGWRLRDPWDRKLRSEIAVVDRELDEFSWNVLYARGWRNAVRKRMIGIDTWQNLTVTWNSFRKNFRGISTRFVLEPKNWGKFNLLLEDWESALNQFIPDIDWSLPEAANSMFWLRMLEQWKESPEGNLWMLEGTDQPANLVDLQAVYRKIAEQQQQFAKLHETLITRVDQLKSYHGAIPEDVQEALCELRDIRPLSRPVADIRRQLIDQDSSSVGQLYSRLAPEHCI